ncbi:ABC transporter permease, partial [Paraclostridium bifermentans]|uniref:ABC transporter permease n=1 Tax=Paraclostridium bifermentans TaxID=1490 RepID=UPI0022E81EFA
RVSNKKYTLNNNGVLITEKLAKLLKVKDGDSIVLKNEDNKEFKVKVSGIVENYVGHYLYMSPQLYKSTFNENIKFNEVLINTKDGISQDKLGKDMMNLDNINSATFNTSAKSSFSDMINNLNSVVILIIVSAGALAFIVLYNLTNVNISERIREIATIKVLGFYDNEVSSYVFRENIILTVIGTILGLILGVFLHRFIMTTAELEFVMFGRDIKPISFILSGMLTFIFATLVNLCMYFKLKKVKMVESLKSVD